LTSSGRDGQADVDSFYFLRPAGLRARPSDVRAAVVDEANSIGTTYLRAQTLPEPVRTQTLALLRQFNDTSIRISGTVPGSSAQRDAIVDSGQTQRQL
jgi:hypothetical protein